MPLSLKSLAPRERVLLAALALLALVAILGPVVPAADAQHFADGRAWGGLPNAMDVLSNLPFAVLGVWGLYRLHRLDLAHERDHQPQAGAWAPVPELPANALDCAWLFFAGLLVTAVGSTFYHLDPDALGLAADRAGMAVAFAGLIGFAICERVSQRAGWSAAWFVLAAGLLAVAVFHESGDVLPWAVLQFGGMLLVLVLSLVRPVEGAIGLKLGPVIFFYALAKMFELGDHAIYEGTQHLISGHTVKHLTAALAALPVLQAVGLMTRKGLRHNRGTAALTAS
jgi:hypothetical protein